MNLFDGSAKIDENADPEDGNGVQHEIYKISVVDDHNYVHCK